MKRTLRHEVLEKGLNALGQVARKVDGPPFVLVVLCPEPPDTVQLYGVGSEPMMPDVPKMLRAAADKWEQRQDGAAEVKT